MITIGTRRCDLTDLLTDQCAHCRGDELILPEDPDEPYVRQVSFPARFEGRCWVCVEDIEIGQIITKGTDGAYVHEECVA